mgnify:FL=1
MSHDLIKKQIAFIEACGRIVLPPYICKTMDWEPGMDIVATKVGGILVLQPAVRPKCCICGADLRVKKLLHTFICQNCIECAEKSTIYEHSIKVWEGRDDYEDECVEEIGELCDYGYDDENEVDYDSDEFMRN